MAFILLLTMTITPGLHSEQLGKQPLMLVESMCCDRVSFDRHLFCRFSLPKITIIYGGRHLSKVVQSSALPIRLVETILKRVFVRDICRTPPRHTWRIAFSQTKVTSYYVTSSRNSNWHYARPAFSLGIENQPKCCRWSVQ